MPDYNPWLSRNPDAGDGKGGPTSLEVPQHIENISWQTRPALPSEYENTLADALSAIFAAEIYDLPRIIEQLQQRGVQPSTGGVWTEQVFRAEMARLGG